MAKLIAEGLMLCGCCASVAANGDDSGCRDFHEHPEHALTSPELPAGMLAMGEYVPDPSEGKCDGCGWDIHPYGEGAWTASVIV